MKKQTVNIAIIAVLASVAVILYIHYRPGRPNSGLEPIEQSVKKAEGYIREGQLQKAEGILSENLKTSPGHERSFMWMALIRLIQGQEEGALRYGKQLLDVSKDAAVLTDLGSVFAAYQYTNMAFACYIKAQKEDNYYKEVYLELGKLYGNLEKFNQAIAVWQDGLLVDPNDRRFKDLILRAIELKEEQEEQLERLN